MAVRRMAAGLAALVVMLAVTCVFALSSCCLAVGMVARRSRVLAAVALVAVVAAVCVVVSPLAGAAVPLLAAIAAAVRRDVKAPPLAEYAAACDRARTAEPPWWPEFEHSFRRECRRRERARRRAAHARRHRPTGPSPA